MGMEDEQLRRVRKKLRSLDDDSHTGYGLRNVHERIMLVYGDEYGLEIDSKADCWTKVALTIKAMTCAQLESNVHEQV